MTGMSWNSKGVSLNSHSYFVAKLHTGLKSVCFQHGHKSWQYYFGKVGLPWNYIAVMLHVPFITAGFAGLTRLADYTLIKLLINRDSGKSGLTGLNWVKLGKTQSQTPLLKPGLNLGLTWVKNRVKCEPCLTVELLRQLEPEYSQVTVRLAGESPLRRTRQGLPIALLKLRSSSISVANL